MNSIERIVQTVCFKTSDRVPVIPQLFGHTAAVSNRTLGEYTKSGEVVAKCQISALKRYGHDAVFALMDVNIETEAVGSELTYRSDLYPFVKSYALNGNSDISKLALPDPHKSGRMPEIIKAADILRNEVGDEVLVVGCVLGPLTVSTQLMGSETALFLAIDEPEHFEKLLDYSTELIIEYGIQQVKSGAHLPIVFEPSASPAVIPPQFFREFVLPRLKKVFTAFKEAGSAANWLHIAGPVQKILPLYKQIGVDIANFDYCVSSSEVHKVLPDTCVDGNIKPLSFVNSTPEKITKRSNELINFFRDSKGFILSSGCEIPPESKPENIDAMVLAARQ